MFKVLSNANGNGVNINKSSYHHGNLQAVLVREGLKLLAKSNAEDVSLRAVARASGVSATSVYRHFPDKTALMTALAREGLERLGEAQRVAADKVGGGAIGFIATGRAYVEFAVANPALYRLIFATPVLDVTVDLDNGAKRLLQENAAAEANRGGGSSIAHAARSWALAHGLAMLMLDGQIAKDMDLVDTVLSLE